MDVRVHLLHTLSNKIIAITGSKSETNRLLLLKALYPVINIENASGSDDSIVMQEALSSGEAVIDVHHAGTAMRFLTAYFALQEGRQVVLTGSERMKERPIKVLVDALIALGADIHYADTEGFPPIKINGRRLKGGTITVRADVSSQYLSALLLIGSKLKEGLVLKLDGKITSLPYLKMTIALLNEVGIAAELSGNIITVPSVSKDIPPVNIVVESDWSSASYFYSVIALAQPDAKVKLTSYKQNSLQGDSELAGIYKNFGVTTTFNGNAIILEKDSVITSEVHLDLNNTPDIAQTIAVTCLGLGIQCHLSGLHTLKIKETDRLSALKNELEKFGATVTITEDSLTMQPVFSLPEGIAVNTYNDHRMAMAFAPLAVRVPLVIKDAGVVSKSYPGFWDDLNHLGFDIKY